MKKSNERLKQILDSLQANQKLGAMLQDDKGFNHRAALASLEKTGVKLDSDNALKGPLDTLVIDAVKAIKGKAIAA